MSETPIIPRHQWTHDGAEVLCLKCVGLNGETHNGFRWPLAVGAEVVAPDWDPAPKCGGGLHGWPWGFALGAGKEPDWAGRWLVFGAAPVDVVDLGGKCKARRGTIRYVGDWIGATAYVLRGQIALVAHAARGAASATGERGAASATGWRGAAVVTGLDGRVKGGPYSALALAWWNAAAKRSEMRCARIGVGDGSDGTLLAHVWYRLNEAGEFVSIRNVE